MAGDWQGIFLDDLVDVYVPYNDRVDGDLLYWDGTYNLWKNITQSSLLSGCELLANKNQPNGYPGLDENGNLVGIFIPRYDTAAVIDGIVLEAGEMAITSDTDSLRIGDGVTSGGLEPHVKYTGAITNVNLGDYYIRADGGLGIGSTPTAAYPCVISKALALNENIYGFTLYVSNTPTANLSPFVRQTGAYYTFAVFGDKNVANITGAVYEVQKRTTGATSVMISNTNTLMIEVEGAVTNAYVSMNNFYGNVAYDLAGDANVTNGYIYYGYAEFSNSIYGAYGINVTNLYGFYMASPYAESYCDITNMYGLYIEAMSAGLTLNYAIYTNAGLVRFGGNIISATGSLLSTTGTVTLGGSGNTNNENLTFDFETYSNVIGIGTTTSAVINFNLDVLVNNDKYLYFGASQDVAISWSSTGNDNLQIGVAVGSADQSGYISIMEKADMNNANRAPSGTTADPVLRIYSSDAGQAGDYIQFYHNQTHAYVYGGNGNLRLRAATQIDFLAGTAQKVSFWDASASTEFMQHIFRSSNTEYILAISDSIGNDLIISNYTNRDKNHDHGLQTNPTLFIHSDTDPDSDNTQYLKLCHDATDSIIQTGKGDISVVLSDAAGASCLEVRDSSGTPVAQIDSDGVFWSLYGGKKTGFRANTDYTSVIVGKNGSSGILQVATVDASSFRNNASLGVDFDNNGSNPSSTFFVRQGVNGSPNQKSFELSGTTFEIKHYGLIGAAYKYVSWKIDDTDDYFHLSREDSNILGFKVDMPLVHRTTTYSTSMNADVAGVTGEISFCSTDTTFYGCTVGGAAGEATWVALH